MLQLIEHIIRISSKRDRTEINSALVDAMRDMFEPSALAVFRCYPCTRDTIVFACAGLGPAGQFSHNAYLPERRYCHPIDHDPLLQRCQKEQGIVRETLADGADRLVFPVIRQEQLIYLIDISLPSDFPSDRRVLLMGLVEYFGHHISLLDYGEADTLTGLANRKTFDKHLFEVLGKAADDNAVHHLAGPGRRRGATNNSHWLAVCDIDHFKRINDTWGHLTGDAVLVKFGQLMRESFRYDDQLFRFGGEEFIAVLQPASQANAERAFERFREAVERHVFSEAGRVTVSIGLCHLQAQDTPTAIIDRADAALYWAKQNGRNRIACYDTLVGSGQLAAKPVK
ncbi:MAG: GGDEF domain-containing protein [Azonexus sp.]